MPTAISAFVTGVTGGKLGQALRAGLISAVTAMAFNVVGTVTTAHATPAFGSANHLAKIAGHAAVGCASAAASGGSCESGALSAATGALGTPLVQAMGANLVTGTAAHAVLGAVAGGGKFANGSVTGAFGYLFNQMAHGRRRGFLINLAEHEGYFDGDDGHTIREHVGRTEASMRAQMGRDYYESWIGTSYRQFLGSFTSISAAESVIGSTLSWNTETVEGVIAGAYGRRNVYVSHELSSPTGYEAYRASANSQVVIRDTYGVGVVIKHAPHMSDGFRIITAYPTNR